MASAGFKWIDHLSTMNIEPEFVDDATKTVVLITESDNDADAKELFGY